MALKQCQEHDNLARDIFVVEVIGKMKIGNFSLFLQLLTIPYPLSSDASQE